MLKEALSSSETRLLQEPHGVTTQKTPFFMLLLDWSSCCHLPHFSFSVSTFFTIVINLKYVRREVFTAVTVKNAVFWDVMMCGSSQRASVASYCYRLSYLTDYFHPDDRGATFLQNIGSYKSHTVKRPRKRHSWNWSVFNFGLQDHTQAAPETIKSRLHLWLLSFLTLPWFA
jgi:hypothetical protein